MVDDEKSADQDKSSAEVGPDTEVIVPDLPTITVNGIECRVKRIATREMLSLVRLVGLSMGTALTQMRFNWDKPQEAAQEFAALLLLASSMNQDESLVFLSTLVQPLDDGQRVKLVTYLQENPDPDDTLELLTQVAVQEADNLVAIAGKVQAMVSRLGEVYAPARAKKKPGGGDRSRARST
jgi:hypothetical protein